MLRFTYIGRPDLTWPSLLAEVPVPGRTYDVRHDPDAPESWQPASDAAAPGDGLPKKKADLETLAESLGLDTTGTAKELRERITAHQAAEASADAGAPPDGGHHEEEDEPLTPDAEPTADADPHAETPEA